MGGIEAHFLNNPKIVNYSRGYGVKPLITLFVWIVLPSTLLVIFLKNPWLLIFPGLVAVYLFFRLDQISRNPKEAYLLYPEKIALDMQKQSIALGSRDNPLTNVIEADIATQPILTTTKKLPMTYEVKKK